MADDDNNSGGSNLMQQAIAAVNKKAKDAVTDKLKANFAKRREHTIAITQIDAENERVVAEYEAGLV